MKQEERILVVSEEERLGIGAGETELEGEDRCYGHPDHLIGFISLFFLFFK